MKEKIEILKLADNLFKPLRQGNKKLTIRRGRLDVQLGSLMFEGVEDNTIWEQVEVIEIRYVRIINVPEEIYIADGFKNWVDFYEGMRKHYFDLDITDECTIIIFE
jgi:hypothetical protein